MTTAELIDRALAARATFEAAVGDLARATAARNQAETALKAANLALHDDLAAHGPACTVDDTVTPAVVTIYTAVDPDTYQATEIRVAA